VWRLGKGISTEVWHTGKDFKKLIYSIHTGPEAMSAPVATKASPEVY